MSALLNAAETFLEHLRAIMWGSLVLAILCHGLKTAARTRAWRNILAASYPQAEVRWRSVLGAYTAGVGVNALLPARGGDVLKLYLVKQRVEGSTYTTLAATLMVETLFDFVVATALVVWALRVGELPGLDVLPRLPSIDWFWLFQYPRAAAIVGGVALVLAFALGIWAAPRIAIFKSRIAQGFAILRNVRRYLREVVAWQALDWMLRFATVYFFLRAFGITADFDNALLVQVAESLSTILPLTPAGIGTEQALLVYILAGEGSITELLSFSVGMKLTLMATNLVVGLVAIALMLRTLRWRRFLDRANGRSQAEV